MIQYIFCNKTYTKPLDSKSYSSTQLEHTETVYRVYFDDYFELLLFICKTYRGLGLNGDKL